MVGWYHNLMDMSLGKTPGVGDKRKPDVLQSMGHKQLDTTERLN